MAIGMPYEEYWYGDTYAIRYYYRAHRLRQEMQNEQAWINGLYTLKALEATVGNLMKKKTDKAIEYPSQPFDFRPKKQEQKKPEQSEDQDAVFARAYMLQMMAVGKNWGKKK